MTDDANLLRSYALEGSEAAFSELVKRYANLVYSVALRKVEDPALAQDLTQQVFSALGRKARGLPQSVVLSAWLHRATCYAAGQELRSQHRRRAREQAALEMNLQNSDVEPDWSHIRPELDDALNELGGPDREAILLRYFDQRSLAQLGAALRISEDAARKRVDRALERLRDLLVSRGIKTTSAALAAALLANAVQAAPTGFVASLATASLATVETKTAIALLAMSKLKLAAVSAIIVIAASTPMLIQRQTNQRLRQEIEQLKQQAAAPQDQPAGEPVLPPDEVKGLRAEHSELVRLRGEVASLRKQIQARSADTAFSSRPAAPAEPQPYVNAYWNSDSWTNSGTRTPDAALQSLLWSAKSGDLNLTKALIYWDVQLDPARLADWEDAVSNTIQSYLQVVTNYQGIRLISQTEVDADTRSLRFEAVAPDGSVVPNDVRFHKTDQGWRQVIAGP
jgi:RNA polymerase sigma factor (sigma-70 family)